MQDNQHQLSALFSARSRQEYLAGLSCQTIHDLEYFESSLTKHNDPMFSVPGFCIPCGKKVAFRVDMRAGGRQEAGRCLPNWRERLICPSCRMSNRQRLMATLIKQHIAHSDAQERNIYLMERTTPLFRWVADNRGEWSVVGSEYFGPDKRGGATINALEYQAPLDLRHPLRSAYHKFSLFYSMLRMGGVRHEDITRLSLPDESMDLIVSNDVFEHVPNPATAFKECARVLRTGGKMLATIPFYSDSDLTVVRAELGAGGLRHLLAPQYHGNPVSADGSLVFTDFGWDIIPLLEQSGFSRAEVDVYASDAYGHLGGGQIVFRVTK